MTAPSEDQDGDAIPPPIARVLLRCREAVAQATERAWRELVALGVADPGDLLLGRPTPPRAVRGAVT